MRETANGIAARKMTMRRKRTTTMSLIPTTNLVSERRIADAKQKTETEIVMTGTEKEKGPVTENRGKGREKLHHGTGNETRRGIGGRIAREMNTANRQGENVVYHQSV
jgi:hypothetical protein